MAKNTVYEIVTNRIIKKIQDAIDNGTCLPWQQPWDSRNAPINHTTLKAYRGVNLWLLEYGHEYVSWNQLCDLQKHNRDVKLRKGSKAHIVVYFSFKKGQKDVMNEHGVVEQKEIEIPFLRYYNVYDIADIDGLIPRRPQINYEHKPVEEAENLIQNYINRENGLRLEFNDGNGAWYSPAMDVISVPSLNLFKSYSEYFSTLAHECVHSTGSSKRLNRIKSTAFHSNDYSKEELVAEIGSCMLCAECGIDNQATADNSIAYLKGWLSALQDDVKLIVTASSQAQKAADYILGRTADQLEENAELQNRFRLDGHRTLV